MAIKFDELSKLSNETAEKITSSAEEWLKFCQSASNLYRYPFGDQLLIYAQRPDAKQCATMDYWNKTMRCYVNKGAKGIVLMGDNNRPKYVFDMSDVHKVSEKSIMPYQWEFAPGASDKILADLEKTYLYTENPYITMDFIDRIIQISDQVASTYSFDESIIKGSGLEEVFDENRAEIMQDALSASVASMILTRCGVDVSQYAESITGFQYITMFNTSDAVFELGTATADLAKPILIDIERDMARYERENSVERSNENGLQTERRLSDTERRDSDSIGSGIRTGEVRQNEGELPERAEEGNVREASLDRGVDESSDRDRQAGIGAEIHSDRADEGEAGIDPAASERKSEPIHEQASDDIRGDRPSDLGGADTGITRTVILTDKAPRLPKPDPTKVYIKVPEDGDFTTYMRTARRMAPDSIQVESSLLSARPEIIPEYNVLKEENKELGIPTNTLIRISKESLDKVADIVPESPAMLYEQTDIFSTLGEQIAEIEDSEKELSFDPMEITKAVSNHEIIRIEEPQFYDYSVQPYPISNARATQYLNERFEYDEESDAYLLYADTEHDKGLWLNVFDLADEEPGRVATEIADFISKHQMKVTAIEAPEHELSEAEKYVSAGQKLTAELNKNNSLTLEQMVERQAEPVYKNYLIQTYEKPVVGEPTISANIVNWAYDDMPKVVEAVRDHIIGNVFYTVKEVQSDNVPLEMDTELKAEDMLYISPEAFELKVRNLELTPGVDVEFASSDEKNEFSLYWHEPGLNVTWYPIVEMKKDGEKIHLEGPEGQIVSDPENPDNFIMKTDSWDKFLNEVADKLDPGRELSQDEKAFQDMDIRELSWRLMKDHLAWDEIETIGNALFEKDVDSDHPMYRENTILGTSLHGPELLNLAHRFHEGFITETDQEYTFDRDLVLGVLGGAKTFMLDGMGSPECHIESVDAQRILVSCGNVQRELPTEMVSNELLKHTKEEFEANHAPTFTIYQLKDEFMRDYGFESYSFAIEHGRKPNIASYNKVYTDEYSAGLSSELDDMEKLEKIYERFQRTDGNEVPGDFTGHSLSMSDVVVLSDSYGNEKAYYTDRFGFREVPDFMLELQPEKTDEISLPNVKVEWSESPLFEEGKVYSIAEYDAIMHKADLEHRAKEIEKVNEYGSYQAWLDSDDSLEYAGYDKTKFTVNYADGTSWTDRQDIGDGIGGLLEFVNMYYPERVPELAEAAGRELDKMKYQLVVHLKGDPTAPSYRTGIATTTLEQAEYDGKNFLRSNDGYGIYDLEAGTCVRVVGDFDPDAPVQTNVLGIDFKEKYNSGLTAQDNVNDFVSLKVGDHLVDQDGVLWVVKSDGFALGLDKAPENMVDTLMSAKSIWNWQNRVQETGKLDDFDDYRKISVEEYLADRAGKELEEVTKTATADSVKDDSYFYLTDGAEFGESVIENNIKDIDSLKEALERHGNRVGAIGLSVPASEEYMRFSDNGRTEYDIVHGNTLMFDVIRDIPDIWNNDNARDMIDQLIVTVPEIQLFDENGVVDRNEYLSKIGSVPENQKFGPVYGLADFINIKYVGSEISNFGHTAEHTLEADLVGEHTVLHYEVTRHDGDDESFSIRTDNLDLMDMLSMEDLRSLEAILNKEVHIGRYEQKIDSVKTLEELKNVEFSFMDDENFPRDMNLRFWDSYRNKEAELSLNREFAEASHESESETWRIVPEANDENDRPQEWVTDLGGGNYVWIDREEDGSFGVHPTADASAMPLRTFGTLDEAKDFVDEELREVTFGQNVQKSKNFHIEDENLGVGGAKEKFRRNIDAIKTLKQIESEGRTATPEEQKILSQYVGWGGLANAFDDMKPEWNAEYYELKGILTDDEYRAARASTTEAFYTSPTIISGIYDTLERMGFKGGNVLEPSCGVGNFFGRLPESMASSKLYGVELDSISGRIAKQLYPEANIQICGYEKTDFTNNTFDVAVGNVPFGEIKPFDPAYKKQNFLIHDYFFAKTLDKVRPGGVVAFVTSTGTMDKENPKVRQYIAQRAEFLGAVRLPGGKDGAFKANAGTEIDSDIIFLKKRPAVIDIDEPWVHKGYDANGIALNEYFAEHPEQIVGSMQMVSSQFGEKSLCIADPSRPFKEQLSEALANIKGEIEPPEKILTKIQSNIDNDMIPASPDVRNFSFTVVDDEIYFRENSNMRLAKNAQGKPISKKMKDQMKGLIELRETVRELLQAQVDDASDETIRALQDDLNTKYDAFVKKYGYISPTKKKKLNKETGEMETVTHYTKDGKLVEDIDRDNFNRFHDDDSYSLLTALENVEDYEYKGKADIFTKRTIAKAVPVTSVETASEALTVCLNEKAKVDLGFMSRLCHKSEEEVVKDLRGIIFKNPLTNAFETSEEYLSGDIRAKLAVAKSFAENDTEYALNVQALESVMPEPLSAADIEVRLGSTWIDPEYIDQFMQEVLDTPRNYLNWGTIKTDYSPITGGWFIEGKTKDNYNVKANNVYGTSRRNAYTILEDALNLKPSEVYDQKEVDGKVKREINREETILAQQKQDALKEAFKEWIFKDPVRRETLVNKYNELFNSTRPRTFSGSHLEFPGSNHLINLYEHQKDGVARILYGGNTLLAHCVGAGKTYTMIAGAMESKRLGLCKKSMFVVPNHLTEQWGSDFRKFYPDANILVIGKSDFSDAEKRKKFTARIATGDYDAVIIGHSTFKKIALSPEKEAEFLQDKVDRYEDAIRQMDAKENRHSIKEIEKIIRGYKERIESLLNGSKKDSHISFEELGIDRLFVDESHAYKNLFFPTKMSRVPGVNTAKSQAATQMQAICHYMDEKTGGRGVTFATGTPISNSMTELYTNMSFLQNSTLERLNLDMFDKWASSFGETTTAMEVTPTGTGYQAKTRFANFFNIPELMNIFKESADIRTPDMLNLDIPEVEYEDVVLEKSPEQQAILDMLDERVTRIKDKQVDPKEDNMLKITNDGRKMALDQRLINPDLPDNPNSKVNAVAEKAFEIYQSTMEDKSTQLIFSDLGTPGEKDGVRKFSVYDEIKDRLVAKGVPADEIAFIHDYDSDAEKQKLFAKVRSGRVRFLLGSTQKMGAGTNVQDKLIALHHVDVPWRPSDLEQQEGRILRQGNSNPKVKIFRYITKGTFDAYNWQTIEHKQSFISQIMTSKSPVRSHEDVDDATLAYAAVKALCADNPLIQEKMELDVDIQKLQIAKSAHKKQIYSLQDSITKTYPAEIANRKELISGFKADIASYNAHKPADKDDFKIVIAGKVFEDKKEGAEALVNVIKAKTDIIGEFRKIGEYQGFEIQTQFNPFENTYRMKLVGETAHYVDDVAKDAFGTVTKMNNVLDNMSKVLDVHISKLEETEKQLENAKIEVVKPFPKEQELNEKLARQSEVNGLLKMNEKVENVIIGSGASDYKEVVVEMDDEIPELNDGIEEDSSEKKSKSQERDKIGKGEKVNITVLSKDSVKTSDPKKNKDNDLSI